MLAKYSRTNLATSLANYEEDTVDGDSFASQSRFNAYAAGEHLLAE